VNEEEIKIKYVLPWLAQTGVDPQELQFERTFSIRIGRQTITVAGSPTRDSTNARLDILVRRGHKNLLIVETKAAHLSLTDDDRDQAISYARLVHPIAPYAVVTNGSEYRLYDSLTKKRIEPSEIVIRGFEAALPETDVAEAQALFLALNRINLSLFCQSQVAGELRLVRGTVSEARKYIPDLHVPREAILKEVHEFYRSNLPGLLLVGQSGSGKTSELCSIVESLLASGNPVLFFNAFSLEKDILDAIAKEFSWTFSGSDVPIQIVKRMESFVQEGFLTIIIDAIDEWTFKSRSNHLASLLRAAENRKIKVIVSCKTSAVEQFLSYRGNPTITSLLTKRVDVVPFSLREFFQAVDKYRRAYQFFGGFEDAVLDQARDNPFLLRVLFDVARDSNVRHLTFSSSEFFEAYYERSLCKTSDVRQAGETLKVIARLLYEYNTDWITEADVRASLGLRVNESLMEELFEYGILLRSLGDAGEPAIGFYFQQLRDYIIAFKALQFSKMTAPSLEEEYKNVKFPSMRSDVFTLYYRLASREHKLFFDGELRANAAKYLYCYVSLIQENFPALKRAFKPGTDGRVGFIGELLLSQRCAGAYGFRPVGDSDDEVYFVPVQQVLGKSNLTYLNGANDLHLRSSAYGFRDGIDITAEVVEGELLPQVRLLVEQGRLNESNNPDLLSELIVETVSHHKGIFKRLFTSDQRMVRYPLKLDAVLDCLLREKLARHYQEEIIARKRKNREIQEVWNGTMVSYSYSPTPADAAEVSQNVERALSVGEMPIFTARYTELEDLETSLSTAVNALRANRSEIAAPLFEGPRQVGLVYGAPVSADDYKVYLGKLYSAFLSNYKALVDTNFPTLRSHFRLYSELPASVYLVLGSAADRGFGYASTPLTVYFVKAGLGQSVVQVVEEVAWERSEGGLHFTVGGIVHEGISWLSTTVENLFSSLSGLAYDRFRGMTLRSLVYSTLQKELSAGEDAFRSQFRLSGTWE
jgi:hypothetical protein